MISKTYQSFEEFFAEVGDKSIEEEKDDFERGRVALILWLNKRVFNCVVTVIKVKTR